MRILSKKESNRDNLRKSLKSYAKYSAIGFQMAVFIGGGVLLGRWLDERYPSSKAWFTLGGTLLGLALGLYYALKSTREQDE